MNKLKKILEESSIEELKFIIGNELSREEMIQIIIELNEERQECVLENLNR